MRTYSSLTVLSKDCGEASPNQRSSQERELFFFMMMNLASSFSFLLFVFLVVQGDNLKCKPLVHGLGMTLVLCL